MKKRIISITSLLKISLLILIVVGLIDINGCSGKKDEQSADAGQEEAGDLGGRVIKSGDKIKVHYTGTLKDETVFDKSKEDAPLEFTVGSGQLIPGFDKAVIGMKVNEEKKIMLKPEEAYGPRDEKLTRKFPLSSLPENIKPEKGMPLTMTNQNGQQFQVIVTDVTEKEIAVDLNHPLAGKELTFDIKIVSIE